MDGINTHEYEEHIYRYNIVKKVGRTIILWGLISYPKYKIVEKEVYTGLCTHCGESRIHKIHGYY